MFSSAVTVGSNPTTTTTTSANTATTFLSKISAISITQITLPTSKPHQNTTISMSSLRSHSKRTTTRITSSASTTTTFSTIPTFNSTSLKSRLSSGETLYGLFLLSSSPTLAEIAGLAGYDYVVVDMEHGPTGISEALPCLLALAATNTAAILRLPESTPVWAKKALDLGPQGIMFPMIETATSAADAVSFCKFPPKGIRGSAHPVVRASGYGTDEDYLQKYEDELLVMVQVETGDSMPNIEAIAAVDGVDCVQMGPLDLSACLGHLWRPGHKEVRKVLMEGERRVLEGGEEGKKKKKKKNVYLGGFAMPHDPPEELKKRGYHMVSGAVDLGMFRQAAVEDVVKFRKAPGVGGGNEGGKADGGEEEDEEYWSE